MEKGKFGVKMCFYTALAFILAYLGYSTVLFLVAGVVIFVERSEWAGRQVIQAVGLYFLRSVVRTVLDIFDPVSQIPVVGPMWNVGIGLIDSLLSILVLVFCVVGLLNNLKGKEANIIGFSNLADWAYGIAKQGKDAGNKTV